MNRCARESAVALSSAMNSPGVLVGAVGSLMVTKSMRLPAGDTNASIRPRKSGAVSACGHPRPVEMRPMPVKPPAGADAGANTPRPSSSGGSTRSIAARRVRPRAAADARRDPARSADRCCESASAESRESPRRAPRARDARRASDRRRDPLLASRLRGDDVGRLLADHVDGADDEETGDAREGRRVDDAQTGRRRAP